MSQLEGTVCHGREAIGWNWLSAGSPHLCTSQWKDWEASSRSAGGSWLSSSFYFFLSVFLKPKPMEGCHPHLEWVFLLS